MLTALLSDDEIAAICRPLVQSAARVRYLRSLGVRVERRPDGSPLVKRSDWEPDEIVAATVPVPEHHLARWHRLQRQAAEQTAAALADAAERAAVEAASRAWNDGQAPLKRRALVLHHANKRRACKLQRTPPWADLDAIRTVYEQARAIAAATGIQHHVDHDIPLQGKLVSGLHVAGNLRVLPSGDNIRKSNRFEP